MKLPTRKDALEWSRLRAFRHKVDRARLLVDQAFQVNSSWYVALSGGKDSTCVLDLVRAAQPDTPAQFSAREWELPETVEYLRSVPNLRKTAYMGHDGEHEWAQRWTDEAAYRRIHLTSSGPLFQAERDGKWRCNPITWWNVMDVWAYIYAREIPYNRAYDRMEQCGIPLSQQRIGPFAVALQSGSGAILKRCWPEWWNEYIAKHPEARCYA